MIPGALDLDLLRTYVMACQLGSLSRTAEQAGRAQSAVSTQMRRLEEMIGQRLLHRTGRGVIPTAEGEVLLSYAKRILALSDEAAGKLGHTNQQGVLHIGLAEEIAVRALPDALGRFHRSFPDIQLDVTVDHSPAIAQLWTDAAVDLAITTTAAVSDEPLQTWAVELQWVAGIDFTLSPDSPLPLITYAEPCLWRKRMLDALTERQQNYRITFTSQSSAAIQAAVENTLGVALLGPECIRPASMRCLSTADGLPAPLAVQYGLYARHERHSTCAAAVRTFIDTLVPLRNAGPRTT
ncbi:LysR family transcriptional regulator [Gluconobacter oxydans]|uniref:LysR substrate-binding domain-containing protein n=1 Tax=Gluconobacter thailandicus TaxID=257438 RepID=UPI0002996163|nr:LysR substrate-binding domain-containing protein [Gluconobacter thailandicus]AFW02803.1 putative HTH-type transcriptional regulator lrhA [Gluconobacter oxydans H24]ANQ41760.1 LysR family transcriptional regulator [Gluconobacter oxydans]